MIENGQLVMLVSERGKRYMRTIDDTKEMHTNDGRLAMADIAKAGYGGKAKTHMGRTYRVMRPTLYDLAKNVKRQTQIIYPKDIGYIIMRLGIGPGMKVIEAGSGSGSLSVCLAWFLGKEGKLCTYERREEFFKLANRNLDWAGVNDGRVEQINRNIEDGFIHTDADALFLDVRTPWEYLHHIPKAVKPGAPLGFLLPTVNQVSELVAALEKGPFEEIEVVEILLRRWKAVPDRMRPDDRMVAHTSFLVFARFGTEEVEEVETEAATVDAEETVVPVDAAPEVPAGDNAAAPVEPTAEAEQDEETAEAAPEANKDEA